MPKLPPPPRIAQNRSGFSSALARTHAAVGQHHLGGPQVVERQAVLRHQPAEAAAERQAGDPGAADDAAGRREPVQLRLAVELPPEDAALRAHGARARHPRECPSSATDRSSGPGRSSPGRRRCGRRRAPRPRAPSVRASRTASTMSATPWQRAMTAGRLSISPLCTRRARRSAWSVGSSSWPVNDGAASAMASAIDDMSNSSAVLDQTQTVSERPPFQPSRGERRSDTETCRASGT